MEIWSAHINDLWNRYRLEENTKAKQVLREHLAAGLMNSLQGWMYGYTHYKKSYYSLDKTPFTIQEISDSITINVITQLLETKPDMEKPDGYILTMIKNDLFKFSKDFKRDDNQVDFDHKSYEISDQSEFTYAMKTIEEQRQALMDYCKKHTDLKHAELMVLLERYFSPEDKVKKWEDVAKSLDDKSFDAVKSAHRTIKKKLNLKPWHYRAISEVLRRIKNDS